MPTKVWKTCFQRFQWPALCSDFSKCTFELDTISFSWPLDQFIRQPLDCPFPCSIGIFNFTSLESGSSFPSYAFPSLCPCSQSCLTLCGPMTVACQAPLSMEFSRQEYWSGLPCPTPGDLPDPGIKPMSLSSPALVGGFFTTVLPGKPLSPLGNWQKK